jgi:hypothetical protein
LFLRDQETTILRLVGIRNRTGRIATTKTGCARKEGIGNNQSAKEVSLSLRSKLSIKGIAAIGLSEDQKRVSDKSAEQGGTDL